MLTQEVLDEVISIDKGVGEEKKAKARLYFNIVITFYSFLYLLSMLLRQSDLQKVLNVLLSLSYLSILPISLVAWRRGAYVKEGRSFRLLSTFFVLGVLVQLIYIVRFWLGIELPVDIIIWGRFLVYYLPIFGWGILLNYYVSSSLHAVLHQQVGRPLLYGAWIYSIGIVFRSQSWRYATEILEYSSAGMLLWSFIALLISLKKKLYNPVGVLLSTLSIGFFFFGDLASRLFWGESEIYFSIGSLALIFLLVLDWAQAKAQKKSAK